jgi:hypothetical protein
VSSSPESAEVFEVHWVQLEEAYRQVLDGTISDAKTALGIVRARRKDFVTDPADPAGA